MSQTATATCFCGTVQLELPVAGPDMISSFVCHCSDCRKITASMFASNFIVNNSALKHLKGEDKLSQYSRSDTIASGNTMTNYFCSNCGTLMYRRSSGWPGKSVTRIGTVDDFELHETKLMPQVEQFCKDRVAWIKGVDGVAETDQKQYPFKVTDWASAFTSLGTIDGDAHQAGQLFSTSISTSTLSHLRPSPLTTAIMDAVIADINTLFVRLTRFYEKLATFTGPDQDALFECKAVFNKFIAEGPELDAVRATAIQQLQRAQNMMAKIEQADADHAELDELRTLKRKFESRESTQETLVQVVRSAAKSATKLDIVEKLKQERDDAQAEVTQLRTERQNDSAELTQLRQARALYDDRAAEMGRFRADAAQVQTDRAELARLRLHNTNA
ncbi:hypothetical protein D6D13_02133 [Aureobasidium pullulans]|nr:hypothetical protein D6D13_02133 [Aureobasidium pullulans]